jgi:hypothetical protein
LGKKFNSWVLVLFLLGFFGSPVRAQNTSGLSDASSTKIKPVEISYSTLGGLEYSVQGSPLLNYKDFAELIRPLNDYETLRLLKKSESSSLNAALFGGAGIAGLVTGIAGLLKAPSNRQTGFWIAAIGGGLSFEIGGLFQSEAQTAKFNCVQRYNRFARGEEQVLPQAPQDEKSLLNFKKTSEPTQGKGNTPAK